MEIQSAFNSGIAGFRKATELATESAEKIAGQSLEYSQNTTSEATSSQNSVTGSVKLEPNQAVQQTNSVTEEMINLRVAEHQALASAKVIATADAVVGSLIDTRV